MKKIKLNLYAIVLLLILVAGGLATSCDDEAKNVPLSISSIHPVTGRADDTLWVSGTGFSTYRPDNIVYFDKSVAKVAVAETNNLKLIVPNGITDSSVINITVGGQTAVSGQYFYLVQGLSYPQISEISPDHGSAGTEVTITGLRFGRDIPNIDVYFNTLKATIIDATLPKEGQGTLIVKVPVGLEPGQLAIKIVRDGLSSKETVDFTVDQAPEGVKGVYFSSRGINIGKISDDGEKIITSLYDANSIAGMVVDSRGGYIYWTEIGGGSARLRKMPITGDGSVDTLLTDGLVYPSTVSFDRTKEKIFFVDENADGTEQYIYSCNTDGSGLQLLYTFPYSEGYIVGMAVSDDKLYWTENHPVSVKRASANGSSEVVSLFEEGISDKKPYGIAIDEKNKKLYIAAYFGNIVDGEYIETGYILSGNMDGTGSLTTITENTGSNPSFIALDIDNGHLYYTDTRAEAIKRVSLDGSATTEVLFDNFEFLSFIGLDIR